MTSLWPKREGWALQVSMVTLGALNQAASFPPLNAPLRT